MKRQWYYRGSLKSCNYTCSYCPFSKKKTLTSELEQDKSDILHFIARAYERTDMAGAVFIVPYGEALVHAYYWEALAKLSRHPQLEAVGAQSNFSFPVEKMIHIFLEHGGNLQKLRLWGTFHPQMTTVEKFVRQCELLKLNDIAHSAGVVGVPSQIPDIKKLRETLPSSTYVWINKMDGLGRTYTEAEINFFTNIDPHFPLELAHHRADSTLCRQNIFVEADGSMHRCNLSKTVLGSFYASEKISDAPCSRRECSCYLAYCNLPLAELADFGDYPAFRVPAHQ